MGEVTSVGRARESEKKTIGIQLFPESYGIEDMQ